MITGIGKNLGALDIKPMAVKSSSPDVPVPTSVRFAVQQANLGSSGPRAEMTFSGQVMEDKPSILQSAFSRSTSPETAPANIPAAPRLDVSDPSLDSFSL